MFAPLIFSFHMVVKCNIKSRIIKLRNRSSVKAVFVLLSTSILTSFIFESILCLAITVELLFFFRNNVSCIFIL